MAGHTLELARSVLDWWSLAGVDCDFVDEPADLLAAPKTTTRPQETRQVYQAQPTPQPVAIAEETPSPWHTHPDSLPETLDALRVWLATSPDVPGAGPPANRVAPSGQAKAALFVLTAAPDLGDLAVGHLLGGAPGALFDRMLAAIDLERKDVVVASMAVTPLGGARLDPNDIAALAEIARHHIALVAPRIVLVLGDKASRAILSTDVMSARGKLLEIKVKGALIPSVVTFHPRILDRNEGFKRAAWESLKQVQKELTPP